MICWTEDLSVGVNMIDEQHKELFQRIDALVQAMSSGKGKIEVENTIKFLENYVVTHFGAEERLMVQKSYPRYEEHKAQHVAFTAAFQALKKEIDQSVTKTVAVVQVHKKVIDWLKVHIGLHDKALGQFVNEKSSLRKAA